MLHRCEVIPETECSNVLAFGKGIAVNRIEICR
jgi:hypothetical protein